MRFVAPCLLFLSLPAFAQEPPPFCETPAGKELCVEEGMRVFLACASEGPCEVVDTGILPGENFEVATPPDAPEGYAERIIILE